MKIKTINWLKQFLTDVLRMIELRIKDLECADAKKKWDLDTGNKFNDIISRYAISENELLKISESVAEYVTQTRIIDIDKLLFVNGDKSKPIHPYLMGRILKGEKLDLVEGVNDSVKELDDAMYKLSEVVEGSKETFDRLIKLAQEERLKRP